MKDMKSASKNGAVVNNESKGDVDLATVQSIIVACDAGMGSSAMGASMLRKKVQDVGLNVHVTNLAINSLPESADIVITHKDLTGRARKHAPNAHHISLTNFLDSEMYNQLVTKLLAAQNSRLRMTIKWSKYRCLLPTTIALSHNSHRFSKSA